MSSGARLWRPVLDGSEMCISSEFVKMQLQRTPRGWEIIQPVMVIKGNQMIIESIEMPS